jgi:uncharacterized membrane protein
MLDPLFSFFERLVSDFSWRRLLLVASLLALVLGALYVFETQSGYFTLQRIDREIALLERLSNLSQSETVATDKDLAAIFLNLKTRLAASSMPDTETTELSEAVKKSLAATIAWVAFAMILFFARAKGTTGTFGATLFGIVILALPFIALAAFLPTFEAQWINFFLYPVGHVVLLALMVAAWHKRKTAKGVA